MAVEETEGTQQVESEQGDETSQGGNVADAGDEAQGSEVQTGDEGEQGGDDQGAEPAAEVGEPDDDGRIPGLLEDLERSRGGNKPAQGQQQNNQGQQPQRQQVQLDPEMQGLLEAVEEEHGKGSTTAKLFAKMALQNARLRAESNETRQAVRETAHTTAANNAQAQRANEQWMQDQFKANAAQYGDIFGKSHETTTKAQRAARREVLVMAGGMAEAAHRSGLKLSDEVIMKRAQAAVAADKRSEPAKVSKPDAIAAVEKNVQRGAGRNTPKPNDRSSKTGTGESRKAASLARIRDFIQKD